MTSTQAPRARASAKPPAERRAAIIDATLPLLRRHGAAVTTRQIAEAAGIAEGTIFRVFDDKESLIQAAMERAFDPAPTEAALASLDRDLPVRERLVAAVEILRRRMTDVFQLVAAVGVSPPAPTGPNDTRGRKLPGLDVLAALFDADRDGLRTDPTTAALALRGLTLAGTHPLLVGDEPMPSEQIVDLVLDGVRGADPTH